jgi:hypothetical protein
MIASVSFCSYIHNYKNLTLEKLRMYGYDLGGDENFGDEAAAPFRDPDAENVSKPVVKKPLTAESGKVFSPDTSYPDEVLLSGALPDGLPCSTLRSKEDTPLPADFNPYTIWDFGVLSPI